MQIYNKIQVFSMISPIDSVNNFPHQNSSTNFPQTFPNPISHLSFKAKQINTQLINICVFHIRSDIVDRQHKSFIFSSLHNRGLKKSQVSYFFSRLFFLLPLQQCLNYLPKLVDSSLLPQNR